MSFNFGIKAVRSPEKKVGQHIIKGTGSSLPFSNSTVMVSRTINHKGTNLREYQTGLDKDKIQFLKYLTAEEKAEYEKLLKEYLPTLNAKFGGAETLAATNTEFWSESANGRIEVDNNTETMLFKMSDPEHALLYFNILGGGFSSLIAPNKELAELNNLSHYLVHESEYVDDTATDFMTKGRAYSLMTELADLEGEGLYYLAWCLQPSTTGFAAYTKAVGKQELIKYTSMYIEGSLSKNKKKDPCKTFIKYATDFKEGGLLREGVMIEAMINAALYYTILSRDKDGNIITKTGLSLGSEPSGLVEQFRKAKMKNDLADLRESVEKKWNE